MANEVRIKLTDEQKAKIKEATGKDMPEIRVGSLGDNPALSAKTVAPHTTARAIQTAKPLASARTLQTAKPLAATRSNIQSAKAVSPRQAARTHSPKSGIQVARTVAPRQTARTHSPKSGVQLAKKVAPRQTARTHSARTLSARNSTRGNTK
ncbi:MAG TPA: hypothetical protein VMQ61_06125 [Thermoanaerobaculia bacterium]|nr:hypothetical protein [Thermoanaerobaculia bacterium]